MFKSARKYFAENVLPNYSEYTSHQIKGEWGESQLVRKGINAAVALYHIREHLPETIRPSRADLTLKCPDYAILGDIVNVSKHRVIDRNNPSVSDASQISECQTITYYEDAVGEYTEPRLEVHVRLNDGTLRFLSHILLNVLRMWHEVLSSLSVIDFKLPDPSDDDVPISREEADQRKADIQLRQGEEYQLQVQFRRFNYKEMKPEPMDLSGKEIRFRVFKPIEHADIEITIPAVGLRLDYMVPLTPDQSMKYTPLETDAERSALLQEIIKGSPEIQRDINRCIAEAMVKKQ